MMRIVCSPARQVKLVPVVPLGQTPAAEQAAEEKGLSPRLGDGRDFLRNDFFPKIQNPLAVEILVRHIVMEIGLPQVFEIFGVVLVQFDDFFDQRLVAGKIGAVQEAARVELLVDARIAPVNGHAARDHRAKNLFRGVARQTAVFIGDVELVLAQKFVFAEQAAGDGAADVVELATAGIHFFVLAQLLEKLDAVAVFLGVVAADDEGAKFIFGGEQSCRDIVFFDDILRIRRVSIKTVVDITGQMQMPLIIQFYGCDGIITFGKIGQVGLARKENPHPGIKAVGVSVTGINQKIRLVAQLHVKPFREQLEQIIIGLAEIGQEVAEI